MTHLWIGLTALYGVIKGCREICKKKALEKSSIAEVLFFYAFLGFLLVIPTVRGSLTDVTAGEMGLIALKSAIIFIAWICSFSAIRKIPVGLYGVMDMARLLFATLLAVLFLHEVLTPTEIIGYVIVIFGLCAVNLGRKSDAAPEKISLKPILLLLASCFLNAVSGLLDKVVTRRMDAGVLQFWYMLFLAAFYFVFLMIRERRVNFRTLLRNPWIIVLSVIFIIGDRALFLANAAPESRVTIMNLIKQCSVFVVIILGRLVFREERFFYRLACAAVVLGGIVLATF